MVGREGIVDQLLKQPMELPTAVPGELLNTTKINANTVVLDLPRLVLDLCAALSFSSRHECPSQQWGCRILRINGQLAAAMRITRNFAHQN